MFKFNDIKTVRHAHVYMTQLWEQYNKEHFGGKMILPRFRLLKAQRGERLCRLGHWHPSLREIAMAPRLVSMKQEKKFNETFLHEMCHQAVSEIDKLRNHKHGPVWQAWMIKVGLAANATCHDGRETLMTPQELAARSAKADARKTKEAEAKRMHYPEAGKLVKYFSDDKRGWVFGVVMGRNDKQGKTWQVDTGAVRGWMRVPYGMLYELTTDEAHRFTASKDMLVKNAAEKRGRAIALKQERRNNNLRRKVFRSLYG